MKIIKENDSIMDFSELKKFAKKLGYTIKSKVTSFGGFGYGSARFFKVFKNGEQVISPTWVDDAKANREKEKQWKNEHFQLYDFIASHYFFDGDMRCIPEAPFITPTKKKAILDGRLQGLTPYHIDESLMRKWVKRYVQSMN